jgi:hypothetical protein
MEVKNSASAKLCEVKTEYGRWTNTGRYALLYSVKNNKFIRGFMEKSGYGGYIRYRLYPGTYLLFEWSYWNKSDPNHRVQISLIRLTEDCRYEYVATNSLAFDNVEKTVEMLRNMGLEPVADFIAWRPGYHGRPAVDFTKTYPPEVTLKLIEWVKAGVEYVEGAEFE